jgi:hypothetical protein
MKIKPPSIDVDNDEKAWPAGRAHLLQSLTGCPHKQDNKGE